MPGRGLKREQNPREAPETPGAFSLQCGECFPDHPAWQLDALRLMVLLAQQAAFERLDADEDDMEADENDPDYYVDRGEDVVQDRDDIESDNDE